MNTLAKEKDRLRRLSKRQTLVRMLGGKCAVCAATEGLEFDHIDRTTKSFTIAPNLGRRLGTLEVEVSKCQLLCKPCHLKKSHLERGNQLQAHGTLTGYGHRKCRCQLCKARWADYTRQRKVRP